MLRKIAVLSLALVAGILVACGGRGAGGDVASMGGSTYALPAIEPDLSIAAVVPPRTIGEELPSAGLGTIKMPAWKTAVGGFTQSHYSQTLAFPPGTKVTIRNLSTTTAHTLDVVMVVTGKTARFPANPKLSTAAHGGDVLQAGYASGIIQPGKSVTVTLSKAGTYLIGCAFHYSFGMRDVIEVSTTAKPGPQATPPPPAATSSPTAPPSSGGWDARP